MAALIQSGDLCKGCGKRCGHDFEKVANVLECPKCDGTGEDCDCNGGMFLLRSCPREYVGAEMIEAINMASICGKGDWPVAGGLMDQASWFVSLYQCLLSETNKIERDKINGP